MIAVLMLHFIDFHLNLASQLQWKTSIGRRMVLDGFKGKLDVVELSLNHVICTLFNRSCSHVYQTFVDGTGTAEAERHSLHLKHGLFAKKIVFERNHHEC